MENLTIFQQNVCTQKPKWEQRSKDINSNIKRLLAEADCMQASNWESLGKHVIVCLQKFKELK